MNAVAAVREASIPVQCAWCGVTYEVRPGHHCTNCGGPLPMAGATERGEPPPAAPRSLPRGFDNKRRLLTNSMLHFGLFAAFIGAGSLGLGVGFRDLPSLLIGVLMFGGGAVLSRWAWRRASTRVWLLRSGASAEGTLTAVRVELPESPGAPSPYSLEVSFAVGGRMIAGTLRSFCRSSGFRQPGEPVWVIYDPDQPEERCALWPPVV